MTEIRSTQHMRLGGEYRAVLNEGTDREVDTGWRPNLILDQGLDMWGNPTTAFQQYCAVGTGTTAPANGQTALVSYLASSASGTFNTTSNSGTPNYITQVTRQYIFAQGAVVGNITELGVTSASAAGNLLFSRCLLVDGSNVPTALTVVALDQLTVYYRITVTPVITDLSSSVTIQAVSYSYTARLGLAAQFFGQPSTVFASGGGASVFPYAAGVEVRGTGSVLGAITASPSGGTLVSSATSWTNAAYTNGNYYRDSTITWNASAGNATGGIKTLFVRDGNNNWGYQWSFTTQIPKDNTKTLTIVIRHSWSR